MRFNLKHYCQLSQNCRNCCTHSWRYLNLSDLLISWSRMGWILGKCQENLLFFPQKTFGLEKSEWRRGGRRNGRESVNENLNTYIWKYLTKQDNLLEKMWNNYWSDKITHMYTQKCDKHTPTHTNLHSHKHIHTHSHVLLTSWPEKYIVISYISKRN